MNATDETKQTLDFLHYTHCNTVMAIQQFSDEKLVFLE